MIAITPHTNPTRTAIASPSYSSDFPTRRHFAKLHYTGK